MKTMNSVMPALLKAWREKPTSSQQRFYINNTKIIYSPRYFPCSMLNVSILLYWITPFNNQCQNIENPRFSLFVSFSQFLYLYIIILLLQSSLLQHCPLASSFSPDFLCFYAGQVNTSDLEMISENTSFPEDIRIYDVHIWM